MSQELANHEGYQSVKIVPRADSIVCFATFSTSQNAQDVITYYRRLRGFRIPSSEMKGLIDFARSDGGRPPITRIKRARID